ncbi:hypothetical protein IT774_01825 [Salinimonas marina]|uniref:Methyltransferase domain-containing protein n=1 Tax=Salinimonas marina TaxID=2785918 RepID=A0A7S9HDD5_9ALTE|nr:hypothetical protein [Salinimonas marina]QPG06019.1 hypothetical protein IT774_01825 [Salinimonas marina]
MSDKYNFDVASYWERRYSSGHNSGSGSYNRLAKFKADFINTLLKEKSIDTACELGCGDGAQLSLIDYPSYIGFDISRTTINNCIKKFDGDNSKSFFYYEPSLFDPKAFQVSELALSLDVIYHLSNDKIYSLYLNHLFNLSSRYVVIYSNSQSNYMRGVNEDAEYVRFRKFEDDIKERFPDWTLVHIEPNFYPFNPSLPNESSFADFYVYKKNALDTEKIKGLNNSRAAFILKKLVQKQMLNDEQTDILFNELRKLSVSLKNLASKSDSEKLIAKLEGIQNSLGIGIPVDNPKLSSEPSTGKLDSPLNSSTGFDFDSDLTKSLDFSNKNSLKG